jgi:hypothetical protein
MAAGKGNADCDFQPRRRQKRTENGLSEGQFEFSLSPSAQTGTEADLTEK